MKAPLIAAQNVETLGGAFYASASPPWLRIDCDASKLAGRWVEITYAAGLLLPLTRPILRCVGPGANFDQLMPGALFGRAIWVGVIPEKTTELQVSPTDRQGRFAFEIVSLRVLSRFERLRRAARSQPRRLIQGLYLGLIGSHFLAEVHFRRALSVTPLDDYDRWRQARARPLDIAGRDAPHCDWSLGPHIRLIVAASAGSDLELGVIAEALQAQPYWNWSLFVICADGTERHRTSASNDKRVRFFGADAKLGELAGELAAHDFIAPIAVRDAIPDYMLAALVEARHRDPQIEVFYGDEDFIDRDGKYEAPRLRSDWNAILFGAAPDLGAALFFKVAAIDRISKDVTVAEFLGASERNAAAVIEAGGSVAHVRRVMRTRAAIDRPRLTPTIGSGPRSGRPLGTSRAEPAATIIIPTRDQAALLRQCIESLTRRTALQAFEVVIVDNGSTQANALRLLAELAARDNFRLLSRPGPFNFAKLCNEAAASAKGEALLFLNNDTEIIDQDWLSPLLYWAGQKDIGAVGAKLLFPNDAVQHAGVVLGLFGGAGHFEQMSRSREAGYFGRLCSPHEVSAVTGACLAVEKHKFEAVGGFDAENLPVELNDVDLCLRLAERGWKCVCASDSRLVHHESMSRGTTSRPDERYAKEIRYFRSRWAHKLRDDPYFHPALSLDSLKAALG